MFRIPSFYEDAPSFEDAVRTVKYQSNNGDLLEGMERIRALWDEHCVEQRAVMVAGRDPEDCGCSDDDFYSNWCYELNAYNVVFEGMSQLFATKETV